MTTTPTAHTLPAVYCPVPPAIHPDVTQMEGNGLAWARRHLDPTDTELARITASRSAEWCGRLLPHGITNALQILVDWTYWGFFFDDTCCDAPPYHDQPGLLAQRAGRLLRMLENPPNASVNHADRFLAPLADLHQRLHATASPTQCRRWINGHRRWLGAVIWQNSYNERHETPTLNDYLALRGDATGGPVVMALYDLVDGAALPDRLYEHPAIRALTEMTWLIGGLDNDLHSAFKEHHHRHSTLNIVSVLAEHTGSTDTALANAVVLRDHIMKQFLDLATQLDRGYVDERLRHYVTNLSHTIRGNLDWGLHVPRYTTQAGLLDRTQSITSAPSKLTQPPDLHTTPAIDWWWNRFDIPC